MAKVGLFHFDLETNRNFGDAILFNSVKQSFNSFDQSSRFEITTCHPFRKELDDEIINNINKNCDAVLLRGGGLFIVDSVPNSPSGWQWNCTLDQLDRIKKPLIFFAVGFNQFRNHALLND